MFQFQKIPERYFLSDKERCYSGWLYKYMSNIKYIKTAIKEKTIYLSHPSTFNDPFDGGFMVTTNSINKMACSLSTFYKMVGRFLNPSEIQKLIELKQSNSDTPIDIESIIQHIVEPEKQYQINTMIYIAFQMNQFNSTGKQSIEPYFDSKIKIFCFSKTRESFPMWAHYADNHKGVCLEYDVKDIKLTEFCDIPNYALTPVIYTDNFITDDITNYMAHFYKSNQWSYEKEVRIVCQMEGNSLKFPYLKAVNLGVNMPKKLKEELIDFCLDNSVDVRNVEISIDGTYGLSFVQKGDILKKYQDRGLKV